jgi:hypothetical protein
VREAMKKFEISVIFEREAFKFLAEAEDKKSALRKVADEFYKYFGSHAKIDGYVVSEMN